MTSLCAPAIIIILGPKKMAQLYTRSSNFSILYWSNKLFLQRLLKKIQSSKNRHLVAGQPHTHGVLVFLFFFNEQPRLVPGIYIANSLIYASLPPDFMGGWPKEAAPIVGNLIIEDTSNMAMFFIYCILYVSNFPPSARDFDYRVCPIYYGNWIPNLPHYSPYWDSLVPRPHPILGTRDSVV